MKTKILMFCMLVVMIAFSTSAFAENNAMVSGQVKPELVDQDVNPKAMMWVVFDNKTGDGNHVGNKQVDIDTLNSTFEVLAYAWAKSAQVTSSWERYNYYNSKGQLLDFKKSCTSQGVYSGSTITVRK